MKDKFYQIIILVLVVFTAFKYYSYSNILKKYKSSLETTKSTLKQKLNKKDKQIDSLISNIQVKTVTIYKTAKSIDKKIIKDEKIIDSLPITNDEIDRFLARYGN